MVYWPLDGVPIRNEECLAEIDFDRFPSPDQFSIICVLLGDLSITLGEDAEKCLSDWSYDLRVKGSAD